MCGLHGRNLAVTVPVTSMLSISVATAPTRAFEASSRAHTRGPVQANALRDLLLHFKSGYGPGLQDDGRSIGALYSFQECVQRLVLGSTAHRRSCFRRSGIRRRGSRRGLNRKAAPIQRRSLSASFAQG
jgi:hypothetical protein